MYQLKILVDAGFDMTDGAGTRLEGIKITIKLTLISDSPGDLMGRVDAAISRLDDSVLFSQISKHIDMFAPMAKVGYSSAEAIYTCIPSLGQTFQAIVNIARIFGNVSTSPYQPSPHLQHGDPRHLHVIIMPNGDRSIQY